MQKILIVDDHPEIINLIKFQLIKNSETNKCEVFKAKDGDEALDQVEANKPDLILLDIMMPGRDGFDVCSKLRENPKHESIYIIIVTAKIKTEDLIHGLECGADDYIRKPFNKQELTARVLVGLAGAKRRKRSILDQLTQLYSRHLFEDWLAQEIAKAKRFNHPLSLVMVDLDHFKDVNDTYGHPTGDKVLVEVSRLLQSQIRKADILARWGGEEFIILLPETVLGGALMLAEKIRQAVEKHKFSGVGRLTVSQGVTLLDVNDYRGGFVEKVDQALYQAKNMGRNRVEVLH